MKLETWFIKIRLSFKLWDHSGNTERMSRSWYKSILILNCWQNLFTESSPIFLRWRNKVHKRIRSDNNSIQSGETMSVDITSQSWNNTLSTFLRTTRLKFTRRNWGKRQDNSFPLEKSSKRLLTLNFKRITSYWTSPTVGTVWWTSPEPSTCLPLELGHRPLEKGQESSNSHLLVTGLHYILRINIHQNIMSAMSQM